MLQFDTEYIADKQYKETRLWPIIIILIFTWLTLNFQRDEPLIYQGGVGIVDPAAQQLPIVHRPRCEAEGAREHRRVVICQVFRAKLWVRQVVSIHPLDLWGHAGAVVWSVACQLKLFVTDSLLWNVNVGLIWWTGKLSFIKYNTLPLPQAQW